MGPEVPTKAKDLLSKVCKRLMTKISLQFLSFLSTLLCVCVLC